MTVLAEQLEVFDTRKPMVGDPVVTIDHPHWNVGVVQSISDETGQITCGWWSDVGYFQASSAAAQLRHASNAVRSMTAHIERLEAEIARLRGKQT